MDGRLFSRLGLVWAEEALSAKGVTPGAELA